MANRFWVGGTGTWDNTNNGHWSSTSGGTGNQAAPTSADVVTFDGSSGGGTVTVAATFNVGNALQSLTLSAFTGTLDFAANDPSVTLSTGLVNTGAGSRTFNMGDGTWTLTATGAATPWNQAGATNLTFNPNGSTIAITGSTTSSRTFAGGGLTYNNVAVSGGPVLITGANTYNALTLTGTQLLLTNAITQTVSSLVVSGSGSSPAFLSTNSATTVATISDATGTNGMSWCGIRGITFTGGATFTADNSFDLGLNTGATITGPSGGSGVSRARAWARF